MSDSPHARITRRAFLGIIAAAGASACTGPVFEVRRSAPPSVEPLPSPTRITRDGSPNAATEAQTAFEPIDGETYPKAKRLASRFVEAITTYEPGTKPKQVLRRASAQADPLFVLDKALKTAGPLFLPGARSRGEIVYPQLGGLTFGSGPDRACVMVVVRQHLLDDNGDERTVTRTLDVRLINHDDEWRLEDLADAGPEPVDRPVDELTEPARKVLRDTRIELPDTARWDILSGDIDDRLLTTMLDMAAVAPYSVAVLKTGHPKNVFGTDLVSGHTLGRGVDVWRVAGQPVVLQQPSEQSEAHAFTSTLLEDLKVPELGSPWDLDGPPEPGKTRPSFTDAVHADHIHVAFKPA